MVTTEHLLALSAGISKRLVMAWRDLRRDPPQVEDALYQLTSVIESTSKACYPGEKKSGARFKRYVSENVTDLIALASSGRCYMTGCKFGPAGNSRTLGKILYEIRNSSFHDPEELANKLSLGANALLGYASDGTFVISAELAQALLLILLSDPANSTRVDRTLLASEVCPLPSGEEIALVDVIGNRGKLLRRLNLPRAPGAQ